MVELQGIHIGGSHPLGGKSVLNNKYV